MTQSLPKYRVSFEINGEIAEALNENLFVLSVPVCRLFRGNSVMELLR